ELRVGLAAIRRALTDDGRFVFETRNPAARAWETWAATPRDEFVTDEGKVVERHTVVDDVDGDLVRFTQTFTSPGWGAPRRSTSTLRFLDGAALVARLGEAGLVATQQFGDWERGPLRDSSPEIITVARPA
ncbi:MAG TPA: SAM-dependent methyltransferase, partial [Acidimicrobiia bacterium]|nr:SAM-dependent methyltransferase [Acidimicrobiia bacterium]